MVVESVNRELGWAERRGVWLLAAALILGLAVVLAVVFRGRGRPPVSVLRAETAAVIPGVAVLAQIGPSAAYAIETTDGIVLIDSGLDEDAAPLASEMRRLGLDVRAVRAVLLTHAHGDHSGGAERLRALAGAKVYAGQRDAGVLRAGGPRAAIYGNFATPYFPPHPTSVDIELKGAETLTFGDVQIEALATPGHSPGSVCYLMKRDGLRVLFSGDVITSLLGERTIYSEVRDPLGTYTAYLPPRYRGDAADYLASLKKLAALPRPDLVLPGHPSSDATPQSPLMTKERWETMLNHGIHALEARVDHYRNDGADFLDGTPKTLLPGLHYLGDFHGRAAYALSTEQAFVVFGAVGEAGFDAFLRTSQKTLGLDERAPTAILLTGCGPESTGGLKDLIGRTHTAVFGPDACLPVIRAACAPGDRVSPAGELPKTGWFPGEAIPLPGGTGPMAAYQLSVSGKTVLVTDRLPILFAHDRRDALLGELMPSRDASIRYLLSIERLAHAQPDLWLPIQPFDGQNANLYDHEWKNITDENLMAGAYRLGPRS